MSKPARCQVFGRRPDNAMLPACVCFQFTMSPRTVDACGFEAIDATRLAGTSTGVVPPLRLSIDEDDAVTVIPQKFIDRAIKKIIEAYDSAWAELVIITVDEAGKKTRRVVKV